MSDTGDFMAALNAAADEVLDWAEAPDTGARDIVNLIINLVGGRLDGDPQATISEVIASGYEASEDQVHSWCQD